MNILTDLGANTEVQLATGDTVLHGIEGGNQSGTDLYLQIHDTAAAVASMTTCRYTLPVPAGSRTSNAFMGIGLRFVVGLRAIWSTTEHTTTEYTGAASDLGIWAHRRTP